MGGAVPKPIRPAVKMAFGGDTSPSNVEAVKKSVPAPVTPTTAEVSQSEATAADGMGAMSRKVKRKGRSATILTSSEGVDQSVTLGTKSLLGG